jgi:hypothetical protein
MQKDGVHLKMRGEDGAEREVVTGHVIAATGYKVNLERLQFVSPEIRSQIKTANGSPILSSNFESTAPGLYFAGVAAANSFGPVMRFAFGARFAAQTLTRALAKGLSKVSVPVSVASAVSTAK